MALDLTYDPNFGGGEEKPDLTFDPEFKPNQKQNKGLAADLGTDLKRSFQSVPGIVTGALDIPVAAITGKPMISKGWDLVGEKTGFQPSKWNEEAKSEYSPARAEANRQTDEAWENGTAADIAGAYLANPGHKILGPIVESAAPMLAGGIAGRALAVGAKVAPRIAGGIGEGGIMAGSQMQGLLSEGVDPRTAAGYSALTGIAGGAIGAVGGKVAQKIGLGDIDTAMAGGARSKAIDATGMAAAKEYGKRVIGGGVVEGGFEELPQSLAEQGLSNLAQDKPFGEGLARAGVEGTLAGFGMGAAFNALPGSKYAESKRAPVEDKPEIAGLLPAPTYSGTPGDQLVANDAERQAAIDAADANAAAVYAAREAFENQFRQSVTIINEPAPLQQRIDEMLAVDVGQLSKAERDRYEKDLSAAFNEPVGITQDANQREVPFTMGEYLDAQVAAENAARARPMKQNAAQQSAARQQQLADEEATQQPDVSPAARGIAAAPSIPIVGPLSAAANVAVQSGAHQAAVMQQVAQQSAKGPLAEAAGVAAPAAQTQNTGGRPNAAVPEQVAQEAPQANAPQAGAQPVAAPAAGEGQAIDLSNRTDAQLNFLSQRGINGNKEAAIAEIARRAAASGANEQQAAAGLPASTVGASRPAPVAPEQVADQPGAETVTAPAKAEASNSIGPGGKSGIAKGASGIAQRQANAANNFVDSVQEQFGLSKEDAGKAWDHFVKNKLVKIDAVGGQYSLTDGRLWDGDVMRQAASADSAASKPKATASKAKPRNKIEPEKDSLFVAIAKAGGMDTDELLTNGFDSNDITVESAARVKKDGQLGKKRRMPISFGFALPLHKKGGMSFDGMREAMQQYGYLPEGATKNDAIDLFRQELGGDPVYTARAIELRQEQDQEAFDKMMQEEQDRIDAELAAQEIAESETGFDDLSEGGQDLYADFAELAFGENQKQDDNAIRAGMRALGFTEEEINDELAKNSQAQRESEEIAAGGSQEGGAGRDGDGAQDAQARERGGEEGFDLAAQTNDQAAEQFAQQQAGESAEPTKEQADRERDAVPFSMQMQSQPKPQGVQTGLFTADGRVSSDAKRGEVGASLTNEQRKAVLKTLVDVYRQKNAPREMKGVDAGGNERYGYAHSPDLFEESDITGAMVRYYVTLPDGRIAHPTELFADYTQSDIDAAMQKEIDADRERERNDKSERERLLGLAAPTINEANRKFNHAQRFAPDRDSIVPALLTNGELYLRSRPENADKAASLLGDGWRVEELSKPAEDGDKLDAAKIRAGYAHRSLGGLGDKVKMEQGWFDNAASEFAEKVGKNAESDEQKALADKLLAEFKDEYKTRRYRVMDVGASVVSSAVAGRNNFNSAQASKRGSSLDRAEQEFSDWQKDAVESGIRAIRAARSPEQIAAEQKAKDDKAAKKKAELHALIGKLMDFKNGDDVRFGNYPVAKVSLDKAGYPSSVTVDATDLTDNKFDLARMLFDGDKDKLREAVDEIRAGRPAPSAEEGTPASREDESSDNTPRQYSSMADIDSAIEGLFDGTVSLADYKAAFNGLMANKEAIAAELGKMTIPQLHERFGKQPYGRPEKKGEIVDRAFEIIRNAFALRRSFGPNSYTMSAGGLARFEADKLAALTDMVNASTAEDLKAFADEIANTRAARQEKIEAAQDPKTIEDFDNALRLKKAEGMTFAEARMSLTPEQRAEYDRLKGVESRNQRKARADQQKTDVRVASQTTDGQVVETKHTKTGEPLFVVKAAERVDRDVYAQWNATAKRMGGYYSAFRGNGAVPGFQFKTRESADAFLAFIGGNAEAAKEAVQERRDAFADDRSQSAVERLNEMAERLEEKADESLGRERKANTERRARFAASAEAAANAEKAMAKTMRRIAEAISNGTAQFLDRVRQKAQIEYLTSVLRTAKGNELRTKHPSYADQEKHKGEPATGETADYAEFPQYAMMRSDLANLARKMVALPNMKMLGQRILKVADDTSAAYTAFAKEHLLEVSRFGKADGSGWATFSTIKDAERSIEVSNLAAVAVPLQIKRGEYRIVLSPSEAINRGIWKGDDRKIYLSADIGEEVVEKLGKLNRKYGKRRGMDVPPEAPWQFENAYNNRKRLAGMGIEQPWEFRAALREFAGLKEAPKEADKIKAMERAMVGRANDGLDFFPTPAETAKAMIDAAEIQEGMAVLEPSAGMGHIAEQIRESGVDPDVVEFNSDRRELLEAKGFNVIGNDFMEMSQRGFTYGDVFRDKDGVEGIMRGSGGMGSNRVGFIPLGKDERLMEWRDRDDLEGVRKNGSNSGYDRIVMNPPFSNRRDAEHVQHAYSLLKPGGRLVAIMGEGVFYGQDKKAQAFREWLDEVGGTSEKLAEGTFLDPSLPVNTSVNARMVVIDKPAGEVAPADNEGAGNIAAPSTMSAADKAVYGMAAEGKSAGEILKFIASASRSPFNRQVAKLLLKTGIAPVITVGDGKGWKMNAGEGNKYAAGYNPTTDTIALFRPAAAERNMLHELMHAATLKALKKGGMAAGQMQALYRHVKKTGKLKGMYGMSDIDEFVAEAFTNPKFQQILKGVSAPQVGAGSLSSAWNWFVRIVRGILGLKANEDNALAQALEIGIDVMREDMKLRNNEAGVPFAEITGKEIERTLGRTVQEKATNWMRANLQGKSFKNDATGWDIAVSRKGINKAMSHGAKDSHARSVAAIPALLKNAVLVASEQNKNPAERESVPLVHHFYAPLRIDGADFIARLVVKEAKDGTRFYDYDTSEELSPAVPGATLPFSQRRGAASSARPGMSMATLLSHVKAEHGGTDPRFVRYAVGPKQTESDAFRRWFAGSKVVDENGDPLVVYHGTVVRSGPRTPDMGDIKAFDRLYTTRFRGASIDTLGSWFSTNPGQGGAEMYSGQYDGSAIYPVYLSIKNPQVTTFQLIQRRARLLANGKDDGRRIGEAEVNAYRKWLKEMGKDGIKIEASGNEGSTEFDNQVAWIALEPEQIKSATGNVGTFDGANPDIRYNVADDYWEVAEPSKMDEVIYALQDKHIDTKRVVQAIMAAGRKIKDAFNPYLQEELFHGRAAKGVKDFLDFELRPLLKEMQDAKVDMGDFEEYLWNRHAEERNKQIAKINPEMPDGGSGIDTADARAYLAGLPAERKRVFESLAAKVEAMNRSSQAILVSSGLEKQSTIDAWNGAYQHYVPLQREDVDSGHIGTGKGFSVRGSSSKRAMGSGKKVVDIIANITMQRERNIVRAEKNRVSNALLGLAVQNPNPDFWKVDQAPKERVVEETAIYTVRDSAGNKVGEFTRMSEAERLANKTPGSNIDQTWGDRVTERVMPGFKSRDNVILTRINGDDHYIILNERDERAMRLSASMKNMDMDNMGRALSIVGKATRYLASVNTQYNPVFGVINLVRDVQGALLNLQSTQIAGEQKRVFGYTVDALRGIYADIRAHRRGEKPSSNWAKLFEEFQKEGGQTGYRDQYANAEARAEAIVSELEQFTEGKPKQLARAVFGWLSDYNETMENAVRLAAYKVAKEKGMSNQQAASIAKNLTVNFNRKGQMTTQIGALYAFFNASVQGTARMAETLFDKNDGDPKNIRLSKLGKKIITGGIMLGSMQVLLLAAAGFDDDEPPEFIRARNLILPIGDGKYLTLAMPLGFHVIPGIGRIATEFAMSGFKDPAKRAVSMLGMFAESFNPVGSAGLSIQTLTPSVVDPFAALAENRDFTGREIYRENFNANDPSPGHARAKDVATVWSRFISEAINFITGGTEFKPGAFSPSPDAIDYLIAQAGGGVARELSKAFQTGESTITGDDLPLHKIPLVGRFVGDTEGQSGHSQAFYNAVREINLHEREIKGLREAGRLDEAREYMTENPVYRMAMLANRTESQVRKLRDVRRKASEDGDPDKVRAINEQITGLMSKFNERAAPLLE